MKHAYTLLACLVVLPSALRAQHDHHAPTVRVTLGKGEIIVEYGPLVPPLEHREGHRSPTAVFTMPADGWLRGFAVTLLDSASNPLPRRMLHHAHVIAVGRRDLFTNEMMRVAAAGSETSDITLPRIFGLRANRGDTLAMVVAVHRPPGTPDGPVTLRLRAPFTPRTALLKAMTVYPMSISIGTRGQPNVFDLPPGRSEHFWEGSPSIDGRVLGFSGHLHRYGILLRFEDRTAGRVLWEGKPKVGKDGEVLGFPVTSLLSSAGVKLNADHVYRLTAVYDNPTTQTVRSDGMGVIGGVFRPRDGMWPRVDHGHPDYVADFRALIGTNAHCHAPDCRN